MSVWMEFRCDAEACAGRLEQARTALAVSREGADGAIRRLEIEALKGGWRRVDARWVCPACVTSKSNVFA